MAKDLTYEPERTVAGALVKAGPADVIQMPGIPMTPDPIALRDNIFNGAGVEPLPKRIARLLMAPSDPAKEIDILPTGEVYASHIHIRRRLNQAVGPMGWCLRPVTMPDVQSQPDTMFQTFALIVLGRLVAVTVGSAKYFQKNSRMDFADTAEAIRSNALTRASKDLGMFSECWDRQWAEEWRNEFAVRVWVRVKKNRKDQGSWVEKEENEAHWRRIDYKPFPKEFDIVEGSPNQAEWRKQITAWIHLLKTEKEASTKVARELSATKREVVEARKEADTVVHETRQETRDFKPAASESGSRPAVEHTNGTIDPSDRKYLIRECKIVERKPDFILHKIVMMNGDEYFTFSTRIYGEMQQFFGARRGVEIRWTVQKSKGRSYKHIDSYSPIPLQDKKG